MEKTEINNITKLPHDMLNGIMLRVPLESLLVCISICKTWNSIIRHNSFKDAYFLQSMKRPRLLFRYCSVPRQLSERTLFHSVYQEEEPLLSSGLKQMISSHPEYKMISAPHRGLVCLKSENKFVLCNPGTNKFKALPECVEPPRKEGAKSDRSCFFGYHEVTQVFKVLILDRIVVRGLTPQITYQVFTVKLDTSFEEESWRLLECQHAHYPVTASLCLKGVLYYGALSETDKSIIVSFNLGSDQFTFIDLPEGITSFSFFVKLVNYNGEVCLLKGPRYDYDDGSKKFIFHVKDHESGGEWREEHVVIPHWRDTVGRMLIDFRGTTGTGELVFAAQWLHEGSHYVLYYDKVTPSLTKFKIEGVDGSSYAYVQTFLNHYDSLLLT